MKNIIAAVAFAALVPFSAFAKGASEGKSVAKDVLLTLPWQQNVYTNRFTIMCETAGVVDGLELQYGKGYAQRQAMTHVEGKKNGTCIYKAQVEVEGEKGVKGVKGVKGEREIPYRLAINGKALACGKEKAEGVVKLWKDENKDFTCAVWGDNQGGAHGGDWGDNQGGAHGGDWGADIYAHVTAVFEHMRSRKIDFGITSGDVATQCNYDKKIRPLILERTHKILSRDIPTYVAWGNHDYPGSPDSGKGVITPRYFESGVVGDPTAYGEIAPDKDEDGSGAYYLYRNDVLFVFVHWVSVHDTSKKSYGKNDEKVKAWLADLLATDRAKKAKFRILIQHAPFWMETWPGHNTTFLLDVAKQGGIDVVFSGHTHSYERIERDGIIQLTNGCVGALDHSTKCDSKCGGDIKVGGHVNTPYLWARQKGKEKGVLGAAEPVKKGCLVSYGELSVKGNVLTYLAHGFNADGSYIGVFDSFTLTSKTEGEGQGERSRSRGERSRGKARAHSIGLDLKRPIDNVAWKEYKKAIGEKFAYDAVHAHDPVVNVSKTEILKFCDWLNGSTGKYRLPTVAELRTIFAGDYRRKVSEWTSDVDPATGWRCILGGNEKAAEGVWTSAEDQPMISTDDCHANYLGFRLIKGK